MKTKLLRAVRAHPRKAASALAAAACAALSKEGTRSVTLAAPELPPVLVAATIAAEDRRFWSHPGVDPIAILRALKRNLADRQMVEGGSTITQQTAKLLL